MLLRTRARASLDGLGAQLHDACTFLGEVRPEAEPAIQLGFVNLAHVREFCEEMHVDDVDVLPAPGEDARAIREQLWRPAALH
jgi:hypothetical protein